MCVHADRATSSETPLVSGVLPIPVVQGHVPPVPSFSVPWHVHAVASPLGVGRRMPDDVGAPRRGPMPSWSQRPRAGGLRGRELPAGGPGALGVSSETRILSHGRLCVTRTGCPLRALTCVRPLGRPGRATGTVEGSDAACPRVSSGLAVGPAWDRDGQTPSSCAEERPWTAGGRTDPVCPLLTCVSSVWKDTHV